MTVQPRVSVIVPHYEDVVRLDLCLAALSRQTYPADRVEVVVADNNSPIGMAAVERAIAGRGRLVTVMEKGAGPARNGAVAASRGEILAFTDSDCVPEPQWLENGVRALDQHDFVGGGMRVLVGDEAAMTPEEAFERVFAFDNAAYVAKKSFTVTANLICPRQVFDAVGGFNNGVSEDVDWSHRAIAAGFRLGYAPTAVVGHPARHDWPDLRRKWSRMNAEGFALAIRRPGGRGRWLLKSLMLPASAVAHTPAVLRSDALPNWTARIGALSALYRLRLWRALDGIRLLGDS